MKKEKKIKVSLRWKLILLLLGKASLIANCTFDCCNKTIYPNKVGSKSIQLIFFDEGRELWTVIERI